MPNKVAIVTAASSGIGAACARQLSERGYTVSLLARSARVQELAETLGGIATLGSVTNTEHLTELVQGTLGRLGRIDAVVNNTGHPAKGDLLSFTDADWHDGLDLLFLPVVRLSRLVTPVFERQGIGAFVNISSFAAQEPSLPRPISSALRSALSSFTKMYAERYAPQNIRMNSVLPGWVATYEVAESERQKIPLGRAADPDEIARVVTFLLSPESSYITGQNLLVDGGLLRSL